MSYASSRFPLDSALTSVNIGEEILDASAIIPLVSGVITPLVNIDYPDGIWTGWAQIQLIGDATTNITYLNIFEDNQGAGTNEIQSYFVNTILPNTDNFYIKYPITRESFSTNKEVILSAECDFSGTAPSIQVTYLYIIKIG